MRTPVKILLGILLLASVALGQALYKELAVDNLHFDGNTISTTDTNGHLVITPDGSGKLEYTAGTASTVQYLDSNKRFTSSSVTPTELGYLSGVTSALQTQLGTKLDDFSSTTDEALVRTDGTSGDLLQDSGITVDNSDVMSGITQLNVDNLRLDGNTLSATDTNGSVTFLPDGFGTLVMGSESITSTQWGYLGAFDQGLSTGDDVAFNSLATFNAGSLKLRELTANGSNYTEIKAPDELTGDTTLTLPDGDGSNGQVLVTNGSGTLSWESQSGGGGGAVINLLDNPSFEGGVGNWTASAGTFDAATGGNILLQTGSGTWDAAADADTLDSDDVAVPNGLKGRDGVGRALILVASGTATHSLQVIDESDNVLATQDIVSNTTPTYTTVPFIFPSSGSVALRLLANADEPDIAFDDMQLTQAEGNGFSEISQAEFAGSSYIATTASCTWARNNAAIGAFTDNSSCPGPTVEAGLVGDWQTTDTDQPEQTINNLPPGNYIVEVIGYCGADTGTPRPTVAITDGSTTTGHTDCANSSTVFAPFTATAYFTYTTAGNRTFTVHGASSGNSVNLYAATSFAQVRFKVYRYPLAAEKAYKPDALSWRIDANIGGANIDLGSSDQASYVAPNNSSLTLTQNSGSDSVGISCSSTNDNSVGSTTCSAGSEEPGVVFNLPRAGQVECDFEFAHYATTGASGFINAAFQVVTTANGSQTISEEGNSRINSGTAEANGNAIIGHKITGKFNFTSSGKKTVRLMYEQDVNATVTTNIIAADESATVGQRDVHVICNYSDQNILASTIVNSVVTNNSGVWRKITGKLECDAGSQILRQSGSTSNGFATIGNISSGGCSITFASGVFSDTPYCTGNITTCSGGCVIGFTSASSSGFDLECMTDTGGAGNSCTANVKCEGPK